MREIAIRTARRTQLVEITEDVQSAVNGVNGAAAIHDLELAIAGKTSEDVAKSLPRGEFGFARETADAFGRELLALLRAQHPEALP